MSTLKLQQPDKSRVADEGGQVNTAPGAVVDPLITDWTVKYLHPTLSKF